MYCETPGCSGEVDEGEVFCTYCEYQKLKKENEELKAMVKRLSEKPILMNTEMVQMTLKDFKTQTRRVIKFPVDWEPLAYEEKESDYLYSFLFNTPCGRYPGGIKCPYGKPGDELWVRETWCKQLGGIVYKADGEDKKFEKFKWKPSIFMPRKYSRIQLRIADIRVERVQDITKSDIVSEGLNPLPHLSLMDRWKNLIDSINGPRGFWFKDNYWLWVIEFERIKP